MTRLSAFGSICGTCTETAKLTYRFIKSCHENSDLLVNSLDTLNDCIEHTPEDINSFNTLFIAIDTNDFSSKQYYDSKKIVQTKSTALMKFRSLFHSAKKLQVKQKSQKAHRYSSELLQICDVIREKNSPTKYKCKVCLNIFSKSFNFKKHFYSQHSPKVLKCTDCDKSYGSEALLKQHRYDCHSKIMCSECGKTYTNRYSLLYHIRRHTGEQPYKCKFCGIKFQWSSRRAEHIRRYHMEPAVECDICHLKFRTLGSLYDHRKRHFNPNSRLHVRLEQTGEVIEEGVVEDVMNIDIG